MDQQNRMSRRQLFTTGEKLAVDGAAIGIAPKLICPSRAGATDALAADMIGGPTGFAGAERYQYGADTPEGRAIGAVKAPKGAGKAPAKIVIGLSDGFIGQLIALLLTTKQWVTIPVYMASLSSSMTGQLYGAKAALRLIAAIPPMVLGVLIQKHLMRGPTFRALKQ